MKNLNDLQRENAKLRQLLALTQATGLRGRDLEDLHTVIGDGLQLSPEGAIDFVKAPSDGASLTWDTFLHRAVEGTEGGAVRGLLVEGTKAAQAESRGPAASLRLEDIAKLSDVDLQRVARGELHVAVPSNDSAEQIHRAIGA